jgi:tetratricopeptide (TPR) repeat protein
VIDFFNVRALRYQTILQSETEKQSSVKNEETIKILNRVYKLFKEGFFSEATKLLEDALKIDFEDSQITSALKCANFWEERFERMETMSGKYEKAEYLVLHWSHFSKFITQSGEASEKCLFHLKQYVFGSALRFYIDLLEESDIYDADILLQIGRCYKAIGNFEKAIEHLLIANQQRNGCAEIIAELGDCYSLINETRMSKAFFREAFFINPNELALDSFDSGMIRKLVETVRGKEIPNAEINEWIPVFGTIYGVFNVKRELKALEFGKLKQAIHSLEKETREKTETSKRIIPKLLNHYFWLIDHYICAGEDKSKIEEVLGKIKMLDNDIYLEYTK